MIQTCLASPNHCLSNLLLRHLSNVPGLFPLLDKTPLSTSPKCQLPSSLQHPQHAKTEGPILFRCFPSCPPTSNPIPQFHTLTPFHTHPPIHHHLLPPSSAPHPKHTLTLPLATSPHITHSNTTITHFPHPLNTREGAEVGVAPLAPTSGGRCMSVSEGNITLSPHPINPTSHITTPTTVTQTSPIRG